MYKPSSIKRQQRSGVAKAKERWRKTSAAASWHGDNDNKGVTAWRISGRRSKQRARKNVSVRHGAPQTWLQKP